jgi:hypothetical protein
LETVNISDSSTVSKIASNVHNNITEYFSSSIFTNGTFSKVPGSDSLVTMSSLFGGLIVNCIIIYVLQSVVGNLDGFLADLTNGLSASLGSVSAQTMNKTISSKVHGLLKKAGSRSSKDAKD